MKYGRFIPVLALVALIPLGGCANVEGALGVITGSVATQAPVTTADAEKGLTVAHLALNTVAQNILKATASGALHGTNAATVKTWFDQADGILQAADQLDIVANAQGISDKVASAETLIAQITSIVGK